VLNGATEKSAQLRARIISGSLVLLSGSSLATALNFGYNIAVARFLGPKGFGHATAVYTLLTLTSAVTLSFQIVSTKIVAQQNSEDGRDAAFRDLHRAAWLCGMFVALTLLLFRNGITNYLNLPTTVFVALLAVGTAFYVPLGCRRGYIQGAYGFRSLAKNMVLEGLVRLVGSVLAIILGFGVAGVIAANVGAIVLAYIAIAPKLSNRIPNPLRFGYAFREISQAMVFFSGQVLINNCDIVLVKHFFEPKAAGLYAAVAMIGRVIFSFSSAVVNSMFPVVAGTDQEERTNLSLITTSLLLVLSVGSVFAIALRLTPSWIWTKFFGSSFVLPGPYGFPQLLALYAILTVIYSLSVVIITYEMSYKIANTSWLQLVFSGVLIASICRFHSSLLQVIMVQMILVSVFLGSIGIPFLISGMRNATRDISANSRKLRLLRRLTEDEVIAEFLKSDFQNPAYRKYRETLRPIVFTPDPDDLSESAKRRALLFVRHRALWKELPVDTEWYEAKISPSDLDRIRVFPRAQWRKLARGNFGITKVVERIRRQKPTTDDPFLTKIEQIRMELFQQDLDSGSLVLIGLNDTSPLTILDGNHRFVAAVLEGKVDQLRFVCGLSPRMYQCCWYTTNLTNLTRYGRNLLRHFVRRPEVDLESLFERSG
jgi:O-antigen/teichoic acid export membrane protein